MPEQVKLFCKDGSSVMMDTVDARRTLAEHPSEWSASPFPDSVVKKESKSVTDAEAQAEAQRKVDAEKARKEAEKSAAEEQAKRDAEAQRKADEQEEKRKADEKARESGSSDANIATPVTNDGLKVGHIPSETTFVLTAKHRGGGSYSVMDEDGNELVEKMSKDDAETFNAMSEADKAEYIKSETDPKS